MSLVRHKRTTLALVLGTLAAGFAAIALCLVVAWPTLTGLAASVPESPRELQAIQAGIARSYGTHQVAVLRKREHTGAMVLEIRVLNSPRLYGLREEDVEKESLNMAIFARDQLGRSSAFDALEVDVGWRVGAGVALTNFRSFPFRTTDLAERSRPA